LGLAYGIIGLSHYVLMYRRVLWHGTARTDYLYPTTSHDSGMVCASNMLFIISQCSLIMNNKE